MLGFGFIRSYCVSHTLNESKEKIFEPRIGLLPSAEEIIENVKFLINILTKQVIVLKIR